jgi:hypothetical protein
LAADYFERIAYAIAVGVCEAVAVAVKAFGHVGAVNDIGSVHVVVASGCILAAYYFERIAYAIAISIGETVTVAVISIRWSRATTNSTFIQIRDAIAIAI